MKRKKFLSMAIVTVAAAGALVSGSLIANAASAASTDSANSAETTSRAESQRPPEMRKGFQCMLPDLSAAVTAGIITQAESDGITKFLSDYKPTEKADVFTVLVSNKVLTQTKADALKSWLDTQRQQKQQEFLKTEIGKFVTDQTITQEQADKIIAALIAVKPEKPSGTPAGEKPKMTNPLSSLVSDGTISQEQADTIWSAMHKDRGHFGGKGHGGKFKENKTDTNTTKS